MRDRDVCTGAITVGAFLYMMNIPRFNMSLSAVINGRIKNYMQ